MGVEVDVGTDAHEHVGRVAMAVRAVLLRVREGAHLPHELDLLRSSTAERRGQEQSTQEQ